MNNTVLEVADLVSRIQKCTEGLPNQYAEKIEELCTTIISVTAMGTGSHVGTVDVSDLVEGVNFVDGNLVVVTDGTITIK